MTAGHRYCSAYLAPAAASDWRSRWSTEQPVELGLEHRVVVERESAARAHDVLDGRAAPCVHEHGTTRLPRLEEHERERLEGRRRDQQRSRRGAAPTSSRRRPRRPRRCRDARAPAVAPARRRRARAGRGCAPCSERRATRAGASPCCDRHGRDTGDRAATRAPARRAGAVAAGAASMPRPTTTCGLATVRREQLLGDRPLPLGVEGDAARRLEDVVEEREADRGLVVRGGMQHRAVATSGRPTTVGWYRYGVNASRS